jgi:TPR repeat protein
MHVLKLLLVLCAVLSASACGSDPVYYRNVQHPNYGQADFDRERYQCERENTHPVASTVFGKIVLDHEVDDDMVGKCMRARGWQAQAATAAVPPAAPARDVASDAYSGGDYATALRLWRTQADQGKAGAQKMLGVMYYNGQGVPQDYAAAVAWSRKAADQGDAEAQRNLAICYVEGSGVPKDYGQAMQWSLKAAAQRDAKAQYTVGTLYQNGRGVPKDYGQARYWYGLAAAQGYDLAKEQLEKLPAK